MNEFNSQDYLRKSSEEGYNQQSSFGVSPLPRASAKGGAWETLGATFRRDNIIVSTLTDKMSRYDRFSENDPNFNPLPHVPPGHLQYAYKYLDAKNLDEIRDKFYQVENEIRGQQLIVDRPIQSFFSSFVAANADPTVLFPGTLFYKNFNAQMSNLKRGVGVGGALGLQASVQEGILQETQVTRTNEESATNIVAATILGASVGAFSGHFLNSPTGKRATQQTEQILSDGDITPPGVGPLPDDAPKPKKPSGGSSLTIIESFDPAYPFKENALEPVGLPRKKPAKPRGTKELPAPKIAPSYSSEEMYHGTSRELGELESFEQRQLSGEELISGSVVTTTTPSITNLNTSIYGNGFYTTNKLSIAKRYTKKGAKAAEKEGVKSPTIYKIEEKEPVQLMDIDQPISSDENLLQIFTKISKVKEIKPKWVVEALSNISHEKKHSFSEFIDQLRNSGVRNKIGADEFQNFLKDKVMYPLAEKGFRGFTHEGGRLTKGKRHQVKIYWYPKDDLTVYKIGNNGGGNGNVPPTETSSGFTPPEGHSVGAANVMEMALQGQALKMGKKTAAAYGTTLAKLTPSGAMATNPLAYIRLAGESIFENNWRYKKNYSFRDEEGQERGRKPNQIALETLVKLDMGKMQSLIMEVDNIYFKQRGIDKDFLKVERDQLFGKGLNREEFSDAIFFDIINGFVDSREGVGEAAKLIHKKFEEWKVKYTELGVFPEGMTVRNSINYFTHYYNVPWIQDPRNRPQAEQILTDYYKFVNNLVEENLPVIKQYKKLYKQLRKEDKEMAQKFKDEFIARMPEEIFDAEWNPRSVVYDLDQIWVNVQNTLDNIMNLNESRFQNQYLSKMGIGNKPKPTNSRTLLIPTEQIAPMLIRDYRKVLPMFAKAMIPNYHITKFAQDMGFTDTTEDVNAGQGASQVAGGFMALARQELDMRLRGANEKEANKLYKAFAEGQHYIKAGLELVLGIYGNGFNTNDGSFAKFVKMMAAYNYTRMMGYMVISSLTDPGYIVLRNGYAAMIHDGIQPIINSLKSANFNKRQLKSIGRAIETFNGMRLKSYADQNDLIGSPGKVSKAFDYLVTRYGNTTGMSAWMDLMQWIAGNTYIGDLLNSTVGYRRNITKYQEMRDIIDQKKAQDVYDLQEVQNLEAELANFQPLPDAKRSKFLALGIEDKHLKILHEQWSKVGGIDDGVYWIDWGAWDLSTKANIDALAVFQASIIKEIDSTIILPGLGDKPLFSHGEIGQLLLQFKGFSFGATNKVFVSGLTNADGNFYNGIILTLFLGAIGYVITRLLKNQEIDASLENLAFEAIDRSGLLGIMMEVPLTLQKMGFLPGVGTSRYQSRDWVGALGGPTLGTISDWVSILNKYKNADEDPLTTKDFNKQWRLFPGNNIWYLDGLNRNLGITDEFAKGLGYQEA